MKRLTVRLRVRAQSDRVRRLMDIMTATVDDLAEIEKLLEENELPRAELAILR